MLYGSSSARNHDRRNARCRAKTRACLFIGRHPWADGQFPEPAAGEAQVSADRVFGINFGDGLVHSDVAALYAEIQFVPHRRLAPWVAAGGGYALYQQSEKLSNGQKATNRFLHRGVFDFGGGIDYRLLPFTGLRGELRDFFSGNPNLGYFAPFEHPAQPRRKRRDWFLFLSSR